MRKLIACLRFLSVFAYSCGALFVSLFILPGAEDTKRGRIVKSWNKRILRWLGVRVEASGADAFDDLVRGCGVTKGRMGRLIVSNHISFLDIFSLNTQLPSQFVAKAEISKWPVFGTIAKAVGTIFIDRGNRRALVGIADRMGDELQLGRSLLMFPEGTTSDGTGLLRLHPNLFEAAVRSQAEVIPVVLRYESRGEICREAAYTGKVGLFACLWHIVNIPDLTVHVRILPAIKPEGDRREVCAQVSRAMSEALGVADPLAEETAEPIAQKAAPQQEAVHA